MLRRSSSFLVLLAIHFCVLAPMVSAQSMIPATPAGGGTSSLVGSIEIKTSNGARVIRGVRHVRHYRRGSGKRHIRRYYAVKRHKGTHHAGAAAVNNNRTRVGNKVLTRAAASPHAAVNAEASIEIPKAKVENLIIHGVNNLQPGKRYIEVVERDGKYVIKEGGPIDPNGLFLEVIEEDGVWKIKGTDIVVDFDDTFDVSHVPEGVRKFLNQNTDHVSPTGNYVEYVDDVNNPVIPLTPETVPLTGPGEYVEINDVPTSKTELGESWVTSDVDGVPGIGTAGGPVELTTTTGVPGIGTPGVPVEVTGGPGIGTPGVPVEVTGGPGIGYPGGPVVTTGGPGIGVPGGPIVTTGGPGIGVPGGPVVGGPGGPGGPGVVGAPGVVPPGAPLTTPPAAPPVAAVPPVVATAPPVPAIVAPAPPVVAAPGVVAPGVPISTPPAVGAMPIPVKSGHSWGLPGLGLLGPLAAIGAMGGLAAVGLAMGGGGGGYSGGGYYGIPGSTPGPIVAPPVSYPPSLPPTVPPVCTTPPVCPPTPPVCPPPPCPPTPPVCPPPPCPPTPPVCPPPPCPPTPPVCPPPPCPPIAYPPPCYPPPCYPEPPCLPPPCDPMPPCFPPIVDCPPPYNPCMPPPPDGCGNGYQNNWQQNHRQIGQGCGRPGDGWRQQWWSMHGRGYSNGACMPGQGSGMGPMDCPPPIVDCPPVVDSRLGMD